MSPAELVAEARREISELENDQLRSALRNQHTTLIDVREAQEFTQGFIPGATNIPRGILEFHLDNHPLLREQLDAVDGDLHSISDRRLILYCKTGGRSALAAQSLQTIGFTNV